MARGERRTMDPDSVLRLTGLTDGEYGEHCHLVVLHDAIFFIAGF